MSLSRPGTLRETAVCVCACARECASVSLNVFIRTCVDVYCLFRVCMYIHVRVPWYVCVYAGIRCVCVCMYVKSRPPLHRNFGRLCWSTNTLIRVSGSRALKEPVRSIYNQNK